jgi:hypothetical protein
VSPTATEKESEAKNLEPFPVLVPKPAVNELPHACWFAAGVPVVKPTVIAAALAEPVAPSRQAAIAVIAIFDFSFMLTSP